MESIFYVIFKFIDVCIDVVMILMFIRAVMSWFPGAGSGLKVTQFIYMVTELFISPVRKFMSRFSSVRNMPIDLSFLVTYILLGLVQAIVLSVSYSLL